MRWQQQRAGSSSSIRWSAAAGGRWTHQIKHVEPSCLLIGLCWTIFNFFCDYWLWLIIILNISKYCLRNPCSTLFCLPPFWPSCSSDVNINGGSFFGRLWFRSKGPAAIAVAPASGTQSHSGRVEGGQHGRSKVGNVGNVNPGFCQTFGLLTIGEVSFFSSKWSYMWGVAPNS
jgi:hypothetical protein